MVVNSDAPTDRQRFTLAHEIGHTVCAAQPDVDAEEMAQQFAGEFLAPTKEIHSDLKAAPLTPARLLQLKAMWRLSAAALMYRATDLGVITESRHRALSIETSALGWRSAEPEPLAAETPTVVPALLNHAVHAAGSAEKAASSAGTTLESLYSTFGIDTAISPMKGR
jgi:Zn-dependent peptidase ImmA (M78 family)